MLAAAGGVSREDYVEQYAKNLSTALEICGDEGLLFLKPVNFRLMLSQVAQLVTDIGISDAAALLDQVVRSVRDGHFPDYDGEQLTPFDELLDGVSS